ncbi:mediator of RNA polymerase II transcription subunit 6-like [Paramacrobiotus metropolitanus]|uniref:mediator of RNA polymerase II transcription subunit 6-like n=1 Tax=Paramacrobiotus metropolitanus TaxID=2943436 RepID=UPI00244570D7|nr:mediator of RNA polymerase II transcription subunit 6-like [Paramacrobiotus metropolitanus]
MAKSVSPASAVSLSEKDAKTLSINWTDSAWVPHLSAANVMDYFAQMSNPFYDPLCNNEQIRMQRLGLENLKNMVGTEFVLAYSQEPILYIIKKQERKSPVEVHPIAVYYILAGTVYQAPDLWSVVNSRLLNTAHYLHTAAAEMSNFVRYHPSSGYYWDIRHPGSDSTRHPDRISFVPIDPTRKTAEESGTVFQRKNVDGLLGALSQKFPPKPMPNTPHPYGPRLPREPVQPGNPAGAVEAVPAIDQKTDNLAKDSSDQAKSLK